MNRREAITGIAASLFLAGRARAQYQPQGKALVSRIAALQDPTGAILQPGEGPERICRPHSGNWAAYGSLLGAPPRSRTESAALGKRWIEWYTAHLDKDAFIDDFAGKPGELKPTGKRESTDAPAATFLSVAYAYHQQTGDAQILVDRYPTLLRLAEACQATKQRSGLTHAAADNPVALLVNNVEVWQGLDHFAKLSRHLRKRREARLYEDKADAAYEAIEQWLWTPTEGVYTPSLKPDGKREGGASDWPQVRANLIAIALMPVEERRTSLLARLERRRPKLEKITTEAEMEQWLWWTLAAAPAAHPATLEQYQVELSKAPWDALPNPDPALLGHALRLGRGLLAPVEAS